MRRQAAYVTLAVSEYFRDQGNDVLCLMDSITRFAMAQREISLSAGEPPASKGYTPSVFAELPALLERAGPGTAGQGSITGLFTVLVEGDDLNEPVADAVRGILDGHVVLDRAIAERGRYPAVNVLRSVSRTMPGCNTDTENAVADRSRQLLAAYEEMAELIRLGAYRKGSDPVIDEAIHYYPGIEDFLAQTKSQQTDLEDCYRLLSEILDMSPARDRAQIRPYRRNGPRAPAPCRCGPRASGPRRCGPRASGPRRSGPRASGPRRSSTGAGSRQSRPRLGARARRRPAAEHGALPGPAPRPHGRRGTGGRGR